MVPLSVSQTAASDQDEQNEHILVERIRAGDRDAFDLLVRTYYRPLRGFVSTLVGSPAIAEELVQDLFWNIWKMGATWRVHTSLAGYLFHGVRLLASNYRRRDQLAERWEREVNAQQQPSPTEGTIPETDRQAESSELAAALRRAIDQLPLPRRQVVVLRFVHGYSCAEVAEIMGLTVKAVEHQSAKAQRTLRTALAQFL